MLYDSHWWSKNGQWKDERSFYRFDKYSELRASFLKTITENSFCIFSRKGYCVLINHIDDRHLAPILANKRAGWEAQILYAASFERGIPNFIDDDLAEKIYFIADIGEFLPLIVWDKPLKKIVDNKMRRIVEKMTEKPEITFPSSFSLELGDGLMYLVEKDKGSKIIESVKKIRNDIALELGFVIPEIQIACNGTLSKGEYRIGIKGVAAAHGAIRSGHVMCLETGPTTEKISGEKAIDPICGRPAFWINEEHGERAALAGYIVIDHFSMISTHLARVAVLNAAEMFSLQDTQTLLNATAKECPEVVKEALHLKRGIGKINIHKILRNLLRERVSIRNMPSILEAIVECSQRTKSIWTLTEKVRQALRRQICQQHLCEDQKMRILTLEHEIEEKIFNSKFETIFDVYCALELPAYSAFITETHKALMAVKKNGHMPVIYCNEATRFLIKKLIAKELPDLAVISFQEIPDDISLAHEGTISIDKADAPRKKRPAKASIKPAASKA